jgi:hypothetical protein
MTRTLISHWPSAPSDWPQALRDEFAERVGNGQVGSRLVSQTERVRVWHVNLKPGERLGFHTHVLDYFWTAMTGGRGRSHYADGRVVEAAYQAGDTKHLTYGSGESTMSRCRTTCCWVAATQSMCRTTALPKEGFPVRIEKLIEVRWAERSGCTFISRTGATASPTRAVSR